MSLMHSPQSEPVKAGKLSRNARRRAARARKAVTVPATQAIASLDAPSDVKTLLSMLAMRRPGDSVTEQAFIQRFILPTGAQPDTYGNLWLTLGDKPRILFSSHTDTVHTKEGLQSLMYGDGIVSLGEASDSNCLGADCTTGVWLMMEMIKSGVNGVYVFHRDEESGGLGSSYIAKHERQRLESIDIAIAFDRKGYNEIITHQAMERCASDRFAKTLAAILAPLAYVPSDGGTFTDTANYSYIVSECTNIGVGYRGQHSKMETQSIPHALALRDALIAADWSILQAYRDPTVSEYADWGAAYGPQWANYVKPTYSAQSYVDRLRCDKPEQDVYAKLREYIDWYPATVAGFLAAHGFTSADIDDWDMVTPRSRERESEDEESSR
jgi:hypothetical protein